MALPGILLDHLRDDVREPESLAAAAGRVGDFAQQQSLETLDALLAEPAPSEASALARRASDQAALLADEVERFLSLLPGRG